MRKKAYSFRLADKDVECLARVADARFLGNRTAVVEAALQLAELVYSDPATFMHRGVLIDPTDAPAVLEAFMGDRSAD